MPINMIDLGHRIDAAYERTKCGRQEWIEGSLELGAALLEARRAHSSDNVFGAWLKTHDHNHLNRSDRSSLMNICKDAAEARTILEATTSTSYQKIWRDNVGVIPGMTPDARGRVAGVDIKTTPAYWTAFNQMVRDERVSATAKIAALIEEAVNDAGIEVRGEVERPPARERRPAARREPSRRSEPTSRPAPTPAAPPPPQRQAARNPHSINPMEFTGTNEEWQRVVDPEFTGTPMEFTALYGHTQVLTAEGYATTRFNDLASEMSALVKRSRELPERRKVDLNWLRSPEARSVEKLKAALEYLRPLMQEAEAALARALVNVD
jgi:hypothetical protein